MADSRHQILKLRSAILGALLALSLASPGAQAAPAGVPLLPPSICGELFLQRFGPEVRRSHTHFPATFSKADRARLIQEFKDDGRPILVVTDGTFRQKSGVVTVMNVMKDEVEKLTSGKVTINYLTPDDFPKKFDLKYQNLTIPLVGQKKFDKGFEALMKEQNPQVVHIMVEGALGKRAREYCVKNGIPFTTAYHTMFPEFAAASVGDLPKLLSVEATYQTGKLAEKAARPFGEKAVTATQEAFKKAEKKAESFGDKVSNLTRPITKPLQEPVRKVVNSNLRNFHSESEGVLVPTPSMVQNLVDNGYDPKRLRFWSHGVDTELFHPSKADPRAFEGLPRPISMFVGRVSAEKNIEDFLKMNIPGTKVVIGDGPELDTLTRKYPDVVFMGRKDYKKDLPALYASGDMFVFPSVSDTFGLVQLEANASGMRVVAYPVQGPIDVITSDRAGILASGYDPKNQTKNVKALEEAWQKALPLSREDARQFAEEHTWTQSTEEFLYFLRRLPKPPSP